MKVISEGYKKSVKRLMKNNPQMSLDELAKLTGLSISALIEIKGEAVPCDAIDTENLELKNKIKNKMIKEMKQVLRKNGFLNTCGTFLERM